MIASATQIVNPSNFRANTCAFLSVIINTFFARSRDKNLYEVVRPRILISKMNINIVAGIAVLGLFHLPNMLHVVQQYYKLKQFDVCVFFLFLFLGRNILYA